MLAHADWSQASPATVRLAQVGGDKTDLSAALFAVDFQLDANAPVQRLMFRLVPADLVPSALHVQRESLLPSNTTQPPTAPADPIAAVLALLQEQKATMELLEGEVKAGQVQRSASSWLYHPSGCYPTG